MKEVTIQYYPFKRINYSRYITGHFPQDWNELSPGQLIAISCMLKDSIPDDKFLSIMSGIKLKTIRRLDQYQLYKIGELLQPFEDIKPFHEFIIKTIEIDSIELHCPKPKLSNMSFGQFMFCDTYFYNYLEKPHIDQLNKFIASVYLPANTAFTEFSTTKYLDDIAKLDYVLKEAVVINYTLIREWIETSYPLIFVKPTPEQLELQKSSSGKKPHNNGWIIIYENLMGDDIVNHDKYASIPLHNVLRFLTRRIKESIKRK